MGLRTDAVAIFHRLTVNLMEANLLAHKEENRAHKEENLLAHKEENLLEENLLEENLLEENLLAHKEENRLVVHKEKIPDTQRLLEF